MICGGSIAVTAERRQDARTVKGSFHHVRINDELELQLGELRFECEARITRRKISLTSPQEAAIRASPATTCEDRARSTKAPRRSQRDASAAPQALLRAVRAS